MAISPQVASGPRVMVVGKDPRVTKTLTNLLELDGGLSVAHRAHSVESAGLAQIRPDILILDEARALAQVAAAEYLERVTPATRLFVLEALRGMTVGDLLATIKDVAPGSTADSRPRHLQVVAAAAERNALATLSERELEVVRLVAEGLSNKEISGRLSLSDKTVKNHISHILAKMGLTARTQVAVYAIRAGLV